MILFSKFSYVSLCQLSTKKGHLQKTLDIVSTCYLTIKSMQIIETRQKNKKKNIVFQSFTWNLFSTITVPGI